MSYNSADAFFEDNKLERRTVTLPNGKTLIVQAMTASQRDRWENSVAEVKGKKVDNVLARRGVLRASLVQKTVVKADGSRFFSDDTETLNKIASMSAGIIAPLYNAAAELAGITEQDENELADVMGKPTATQGASGEQPQPEAKHAVNY